MSNFIRVNLVIFEDDSPWLYHALAAINPKRRARYMREKLLLSHTLSTQLTVSPKITPPMASSVQPPETLILNGSRSESGNENKLERATSSVLAMLDDTNNLCGLSED